MKAQGMLRALAAFCVFASASGVTCWGQEDATDSGARWWERGGVHRAAWGLDEPLPDFVIESGPEREATPVAWDAPLDPTPLPPPPDVALTSPSDVREPVETIPVLRAPDLSAPSKPQHLSDESAVVPSSGPSAFIITGELQIDALWFSQTEASRIAVGNAPDAFDFRRARLMVHGETGDVFNYALGMDFAQGSGNNGRPRFLDAFVDVKDLPYVNNLRVGHTYEPFSLERLTPYVRMKVNLIRSYRDGPPNDHSNATILGIRWDVDF